MDIFSAQTDIESGLMDTADAIAAIAAELRAERAAKRMTITQLSQRSGVPSATLNRYLAGQRDVPVSTIIALASALEVDPGELLDRAVARAQGEQL